MLAHRENVRRLQAQQTGIILNWMKRRPCLSFLRALITRGAHEHDEQELFWRGWEEDPVHRARMQREREANIAAREQREIFLGRHPI